MNITSVLHDWGSGLGFHYANLTIEVQELSMKLVIILISTCFRIGRWLLHTCYIEIKNPIAIVMVTRYAIGNSKTFLLRSADMMKVIDKIIPNTPVIIA
ncbi:MAG: hypothetical protein ACXAAT_20500, partial [Candidatus Hodarchaeales archaeon]